MSRVRLLFLLRTGGEMVVGTNILRSSVQMETRPHHVNMSTIQIAFVCCFCHEGHIDWCCRPRLSPRSVLCKERSPVRTTYIPKMRPTPNTKTFLALLAMTVSTASAQDVSSIGVAKDFRALQVALWSAGRLASTPTYDLFKPTRRVHLVSHVACIDTAGTTLFTQATTEGFMSHQKAGFVVDPKSVRFSTACLSAL